MRAPVLLTLLLCLALSDAGRAADSDWRHAPYQLGQGLQFPALGLDVGGYLNVQYQDLAGHPGVTNLHDVSLFVNKRLGSRWSLFTELEMGEALAVTAGGDLSADPEFDVERLYADYRAGPAVTLRLGKFLTPVGRWNMIHADPLVWTVSRPLTTTAAFARHASGAMLYGSLPALGHDLDYWLFADNTARLDPLERREPAFETEGSGLTISNTFDSAVGGRLVYHFVRDRLSIGASYLHAEMSRPQPEKNLFGLDVHWQSHGVELSSEAIYRTSAGTSAAPDERGAFLQAVFPLPRQLYLVARLERYRAAVLPRRTDLGTLGLTYRPRPPLSFKLEYRTGSGNRRAAPSGLLGSVAILF